MTSTSTSTSPLKINAHLPPLPAGVPFNERTVHIDTAPAAADAGPSSQAQHADVAGVLRRNQACLQCRKRKLARPHCATCVRSYKHLLRTSPKSNPVLCCDYDDGNSHSAEPEKGPSSATTGPEEDDGGGKKKRKASGEGKRKKKDEEFEEERDRLTKKIEELQAQLTNQLQPPTEHATQPTNIPPNRSWSSAAQPYQEPSDAVPSPTAFLEMLSSTASKQTQDAAAETGPIWGGGPLDQLQEDNPLGFKPMFMFNNAQQQASRNTFDSNVSPGITSEDSRRSSLQNPNSSSMTEGDSSSGPPNMLSPNGIFNFSPGPTGPIDTSQHTLGSQWPPVQIGPDGLQPSTKTDGPWRAVETIETVFQASMSSFTAPGVDPLPTQEGSGMDTDINLDGLQAGLDAAMQQQLLMDLFWPGWPVNLPEPNVVNDLIEAFFKSIPNLQRLLHRPRFLARMALPPTHSNFPHPALIHAICAAAAAWCPPEVYEKSSRVKQWEWQEYSTSVAYGPPGMETKGQKTAYSFGLAQAAFAKDAVQDGLNTGNRLFDVVRAMIILCRVFIDDTRMLECWAYGGLVARMILPLGLNVRSAELSLKSVMLPPAVDALEREERRAAVWMAFYHDTIASAASGWGTSMSIDELSVPLPVSAKDFDEGNESMEPNPQDLESPDLWVKHPVADSFVMTLKATILMNRVNRFARKWKNRHLRENDDYDGMNKPEFRELANAISCFQMSFPPTMRDVTKLTPRRSFDIDLIAARMLPHAAVICLYEPFADITDADDPSTRRILAATQAIVSIVQQLASVVSDGGAQSAQRNFTSAMHSSASICLVTSARTSLLFLRHALNTGDLAAAQTHRTDCEMIRMALAQFGLRFKIGHHHAQLIEYFMDRVSNPSYEKLMVHYPEHPRPGAPELTPTSDLGICILNALNVKRGFWRIGPKAQSTSIGASPLGSTPESMTGGGSGGRGNYASASTSSSVSNHLDGKSPNDSRSPDGARGKWNGAGWENNHPHGPVHQDSMDSNASMSSTAGPSLANYGGQTQNYNPCWDPANRPDIYGAAGDSFGSTGSGHDITNNKGMTDFNPSTDKIGAKYGPDAIHNPIHIAGGFGLTTAFGGNQGSAAPSKMTQGNGQPSVPAQPLSYQYLSPEMEARIDATKSVRPDGHYTIFSSFTQEELARPEARSPIDTAATANNSNNSANISTGRVGHDNGARMNLRQAGVGVGVGIGIDSETAGNGIGAENGAQVSTGTSAGAGEREGQRDPGPGREQFSTPEIGLTELLKRGYGIS
ncbi:hypothetical protein I317_06745 [Kwoniella heveanensis CBS 569]|nr:hypothetical protein I317_06745 [Kwoniella heveanensis CBS 569]